jgi:glycine/D-amino acid oxidase-like deaminating enzyme
MASVQKWNIAQRKNRRLRLLATPEELTEAREAVAQMRAAGFHPQLLEGTALQNSIWGKSLSQRIVGLQDDGERGAWIDVPALHAKLLAIATADPRIKLVSGDVASVAAYANADLTVVTDQGLTITAGAFIAANHLQVGTLIPSLKSALVSSADQWLTIPGHPAQSVRLDPVNTASPWNQAGVVFSAFHNHEWGVTAPDGSLTLGGGRILRKWAGFEAKDAPIETKIRAYILGQTQASFPNFNETPAAFVDGSGLDCHPCDELPIIGPMYGEGRILVATGFMGQGISLGFYAGFCLAKLLMTGQCNELPRRLWPERLRSLPDQE